MGSINFLVWCHNLFIYEHYQLYYSSCVDCIFILWYWINCSTFIDNFSSLQSNIMYILEWVKEWWQVSHFVCNFCDYSPYYCSRWHQLAWNFDRYFLFQKLVPFSSLILTYSIRILKILNIKHNLLVKYPQNISICGEYSQA